MTEYYCGKCKCWQAPDKFYPSRAYRNIWCKICVAQNNRERRARARDKAEARTAEDGCGEYEIALDKAVDWINRNAGR